MPYHSLGRSQSLHLIYNSMSADVWPIITFGWDDIAAEMADYLEHAPEAALSKDGNPVLRAQITFTGPGGTVTGPLYYWQVQRTANAVTAAIQTDLSSLRSGQYSYTLTAYFLGKERVSTGSLLLDNRIDSIFGRGWSLAGVQELDYGGTSGGGGGNGNGNGAPPPAGDSVQIRDASGQVEVFDRVTDPASLGCDPTSGSTFYVSRLDGRTIVEQLPDGSWRRKLQDGTEYEFAPKEDPDDPAPSVFTTFVPLRKVTDRYGNVTEYRYDALGHISAIVDPVGLVTRFEYAGDRVSAIVDPAGRRTRLSYSGKNLVAITDPDGSRRSFGYDAQGRMTLEVNKLLGQEDTYYGDHGRVIQADRPDGSSILVSAWQAQGLPKTDDDPKPWEYPAYARPVRFDQLTGTYTFANGNEKEVTFNERGQVLEARDDLGLLQKFERDAMGNVLRYTDERGHVVTNTYDERGNRLTFRDEESAPDTETEMIYDGTFDIVTSVTDELGRTTTYLLDAKGNVLRDHHRRRRRVGLHVLPARHDADGNRPVRSADRILLRRVRSPRAGAEPGRHRARCTPTTAPATRRRPLTRTGTSRRSSTTR